MSATPLFLGFPGGLEFVVVLLVVALLFGPKRLPRLANAGGRAMAEFERGREEIESEIRAATASEGTTTTVVTTNVATASESDDDSDSADDDPTADATTDGSQLGVGR